MKLNVMDIFQIFSKKIIKSLLVIGDLWKGRRKAVQHKKYLEKKMVHVIMKKKEN